MRLSILILLNLSFLSTAYAHNDLYSTEFQQCLDQSNGITSKNIACIKEESDLQDKRLNTAYKVLKTSISKERQEQLKTAQRLWIQYRDANCAFYHDPEGGSLARVMANDCMLEETANRAKELEDLRME